MKRGRNRKGQIQISFGMIFSIILIIVFVAVAVYAIIKFLDVKKCGDVGLFKNDLQDSINNAWASDEISDKISLNLPTGIGEICIVDNSKSYSEYEDAGRYLSSEDNLFFYPLGSSCSGMESFSLEHLNIEKITENKNPYCIKNVNGKVEIKIEKSFYDALVCIGENCKSFEPSVTTKTKTSKTTCQKAENDNLCAGLDLVYSSGYKESCCSEHSLCCR